MTFYSIILNESTNKKKTTSKQFILTNSNFHYTSIIYRGWGFKVKYNNILDIYFKKKSLLLLF